MTTEEKYAQLVKICKKVLANWDKAGEEKYDELQIQEFSRLDDVAPIREFLFLNAEETE